jgi:hypothetical protein
MNARKSKLVQRLAICVDDANYPASLQRHMAYRVIADKEAEADGDLRIIDESGEDYLYLAERFVVVEVVGKASKTLAKSFS